VQQEPYSEQVVLLDGQGIWYRRPSLPQTWEPRVAYGLQPQWHVYMCAQSVFKMHPVMDHVFARILREDPQVRHQAQTQPKWASGLSHARTQDHPPFLSSVGIT
jgi:hypothetical protein